MTYNIGWRPSDDGHFAAARMAAFIVHRAAAFDPQETFARFDLSTRLAVPIWANIDISAMKADLTINGGLYAVDVAPDTKLLWVLREHLKLYGTKYGCGMAMCGACMVHIDGVSTYACQLSVSQVIGKSITTIEGLAENNDHPLQQAWIEEQVPQCGYCQSGQIMRAADLLAKNRQPSRAEIIAHMNTNLCRCGTYPRIIKAIEKAAIMQRRGNNA